jgi:hypothetical protein
MSKCCDEDDEIDSRSGLEVGEKVAWPPRRVEVELGPRLNLGPRIIIFPMIHTAPTHWQLLDNQVSRRSPHGKFVQLACNSRYEVSARVIISVYSARKSEASLDRKGKDMDRDTS